jgi:hypothetical protein
MNYADMQSKRIKPARSVTLLIFIWEVPRSNPGCDKDYDESDLWWSTSVSPGEYGENTLK